MIQGGFHHHQKSKPWATEMIPGGFHQCNVLPLTYSFSIHYDGMVKYPVHTWRCLVYGATVTVFRPCSHLEVCLVCGATLTVVRLVISK